MEGEKGEIIVQESATECDLGVTVDGQLTFTDHITTVTKKANRVLYTIKRSMTYLDKHTLLLLYKALVRPLIEYADAVWNPIWKKDRDCLERIQRRATKTVTSLKHMQYEDRLKELNLPTLSFRRLRGDMIQAYKFTHDEYKTAHNVVCMDARPRFTRGHSYKMLVRRTRLNIRTLLQ